MLCKWCVLFTCSPVKVNWDNSLFDSSTSIWARISKLPATQEGRHFLRHFRASGHASLINTYDRSGRFAHNHWANYDQSPGHTKYCNVERLSETSMFRSIVSIINPLHVSVSICVSDTFLLQRLFYTATTFAQTQSHRHACASHTRNAACTR